MELEENKSKMKNILFRLRPDGVRILDDGEGVSIKELLASDPVVRLTPVT